MGARQFVSREDDQIVPLQAVLAARTKHRGPLDEPQQPLFKNVD